MRAQGSTGELADVLARLEGVKRSGAGYVARCPCHDDREPSLSIGEGDDGRLLLRCFAGCTWDELRSALGLEAPNGNGSRSSVETARYHYLDENGRKLYDKVRFAPKRFVREPRGVPSSLYRLELLASVEGLPLFLSESEKDVEALLELGRGDVVAVSSGGSTTWRDEWSDKIARARPRYVAVCEHHDEPGRKFAARVAAELSKRGLSVRVLDFPGAEGRDVADAIRDGLTLDEFLARAESAPEWSPTAAPSSPAVEALPAFLERLDRAPPLRWHVPGLVPDEAICLWHGQPRDFKSMCAEEVALALAGGRTPFALERFRVERAVRVAYFSEEDPERLFAARMRWLTARTGVPELLFPFIRHSMSFDSHEARNEILRAIQACEAEVAFFDPLRSFTGQSDKGPADFSPVARFLRQIQGETTAKALVIPHHDTKPLAVANANPDRSRSQQASGGGIFSISDCPVSFRKLDWNRVGVFPEDYKLSGDPKPFEVEFQTDAWTDENGAPRFGTWVSPVATTKEEREVGAGVTRDKVLAFLEESRGRWFSTAEVESGASVRRGTARPALDELREGGLVEYATKARAKELGRRPNADLWSRPEQLSPVSPRSLPGVGERVSSLSPLPIGERDELSHATEATLPRGTGGES